MKLRTTILFVLAIAGVLSMTSCVKNYTCQCSIVYSGYPGLPDSSAQSFSIKDSKSDAQSTCKAQSGTYTNGSITSVETCILY